MKPIPQNLAVFDVLKVIARIDLFDSCIAALVPTQLGHLPESNIESSEEIPALQFYPMHIIIGAQADVLFCQI